LRETFEVSTQFIAHFAKGAEPLLFRVFDRGRISEAVMQARTASFFFTNAPSERLSLAFGSPHPGRPYVHSLSYLG
jgi:hypothetical protein